MDFMKLNHVRPDLTADSAKSAGTLASVRRGGMAEKTAKCEAYAKIGSLI